MGAALCQGPGGSEFYNIGPLIRIISTGWRKRLHRHTGQGQRGRHPWPEQGVVGSGGAGRSGETELGFLGKAELPKGLSSSQIGLPQSPRLGDMYQVLSLPWLCCVTLGQSLHSLDPDFLWAYRGTENCPPFPSSQAIWSQYEGTGNLWK